MKASQILSFIDKEMKQQEGLLTEDYERNRAINWRLIGMKDLRANLVKAFTLERDKKRADVREKANK